MANLCKHVVVLGLLIFLELSGGASGEISAEDVYDLLSRSIFKIENDMENIKRRIDKVEEMFKGISTTVTPQLAGSEIKEEGIMENINMQALAIKKTLTAEKLILRDTVETFESKFAEFKSQIQNEIVSINASLESKSEVMIANIIMQQSTTQTTLNSLQKSLNTLSSTVSSISNKQTNTIQPELTSLSSRIASVSSSLSSNISSLSDRIYEKEKRTVSFYAQMTTPDSYYNQNERINDFNLIIRNEGNGFDNSTGIFTAPLSGTYWFSLIISVPSEELLKVDIKRNDGYIGHAVVSKTDTMGTATAVKYLNKGDRVWAQTSGYGPSTMHIQSIYTFFNGFLID